MKKIFFIVITLWGFSSCSDFLEPKSPDEYVPKSADALNEMLLGNAYAKTDNTSSLFAYHNILDDDVEVTNEPISYNVSIDDFSMLYSWDPDMLNVAGAINVWGNYYRMILGANAALDYLKDVKGGNEEKTYVCLLYTSNNLDIQNMEIMTSTIRDYRGTVIVVSHDRRFIKEIGVERYIEL